MLDVEKIIKDTLFFDEGCLEKQLKPGESYLGSDMFVRVFPDKVMLYYLESSDQIEIPSSYINLFQSLQTREGYRLKNLQGDLQEFISLGINLPGIFLHKTDSRGIRHIISKMIILGTKKLRKIVPKLEPWILNNVRDKIEI